MENFDWETLSTPIRRPDGETSRIYLSPSPESDLRLRQYCKKTRSKLGHTFTQALIAEGDYVPGEGIRVEGNWKDGRYDSQYSRKAIANRHRWRSENASVRVTVNGWYLIEFPLCESRVVILRTPPEKQTFLRDCGTDTLEGIVEIPEKYFELGAAKR
jgi:hypothetical protein